jgi:hypothetical protein
MNVVCTHCAHEFEMTDEAVTLSGGATNCPECGEETSLGSLPSGATLPWHPEMDDAPPVPPETPPAPPEDAGQPMPGAGSEDGPSAPGKPKEQSVLFKLGEMQAMGMQSSARQGDGPPEASGLLDIRMLAATIQHHDEDERASHHVEFVGRAKASGPMALPTSSPSFAPSSGGAKGLSGGLIAAAVVFVVLVVAALALVYFLYAMKAPKGGEGDTETQASAAVPSMEPAMRRAAAEAMESAMRPLNRTPPMRAAGMDSMEPAMEPAKPKKKPRKLRRKHIKEGVATVNDKIADCKKDRKGRFKLRITVVGKTGKVKRVRVNGRRNRKSKTGKCLKALFEKAQFTPFKRRRQSFTHRVRIK